MKPSMLYEALLALIGERVPLHIWGSCGVGKSQIVSQVAGELEYQFLDVRAVQLDPVDLRGLPRIHSDSTEWVPPKFLPVAGRGILFLDELTSAPQMTQAGCYQLVLDRKLGEYVLPPEWVVVAAGNPASERGVHFSMPRPLRNRFVHLHRDADLKDWCKWAVSAGIRPEMRPNRRHIWQGLYLPGVIREGVGEIVIAVDCSGSVSARLLSLFEAEIRSILEGQRPERVHVLYFDTRVHKVDVYAAGRLISLNPVGGGGTDFRPCFDWWPTNRYSRRCWCF